MTWDQSKPVDLVTFSYSLSMIPNIFAVLDFVDRVLSPDGHLGVCDFYVSGKAAGPHDQAVGSVRRQMNWLTRVFWLHWFEFDHVDLHPSRRQYLEWRFGTLKSFNGRNHLFWPLKLNIP
jgi:betaine lipid synthase